MIKYVLKNQKSVHFAGNLFRLPSLQCITNSVEIKPTNVKYVKAGLGFMIRKRMYQVVHVLQIKRRKRMQKKLNKKKSLKDFNGKEKGKLR